MVAGRGVVRSGPTARRAMPVRLLGAVVLTAWTAAATLAGDPAPSAQAVEPEGGPIALTPDQCADGFNDSPLGWSPA